MKISNLLNCFFYFWKLILFSDNLYSIIFTNIFDIFGHECWKVMINYENQSQIESKISNNLTFICWCLISPKNMFKSNMQEYLVALFVNWGYRLCQLYLTQVVALQPANVCSGYVSKPSDGKSPVLEVWVIWSTLSLLLVLGYKKIMSYPLDSCVPRCGEAEGKGRR